MDCNKDEAVRAKQLAEMKMKNNDFVGARKIVQKAQNLCPGLENISQLLSICDVHCSAQNLMHGSEKDWYGVLQIERFADEMKIKKQYRRLALFLHPDKNPFPGAEAAFKLICEANTVLSDPQKKSLYDSKIRVMVRSAQVAPPPDRSNFQVNKKYAEMKASNGYRSMNQHKTTQSSYSTQVFCTSCPNCSFKYWMDRKFVNRLLRCQKCSMDFTGHEMGAQGVPLSKCAPESSQNGDVQNGKGYTASYMGSQWCANKQTGQPQPGVPTESMFKDQGVGKAAKVSRNVKAKRKDSGSNNEDGGKEGGTCKSYPNSKEGIKKNKRKGRRRVASESSESDDTSSESDLEDVAAGCGVATNLNSRPTRRSSRKRQNIPYTEGGDDDNEDDENRQNHAMDVESAEHGNQNGLNTDADLSKSKRKETGSVYPEERPQDKSDSEKGVKAKGEGGGKPNIGDDAVEIEIDSDWGADSGDDSYKESYQCADPEFNNFDSDVSCFAVNQYWSCYDSADGMPRFYAKVKKVRLSPFELSIAWLEADSADDTLKKWIDEELPVGCGTFRVGKTQKISGRDTFAQQVHCEKGKRGSLIIHPRRGEVWALFRDWDLSWSSQPDSHKEFKYEVVEVLSDFDAMGVRVCYLDKVEGFVSLFQRSRQSAIESFMIRPKEIYRLSHCIRSFKMTGSERGGVPVGSFELDPAALPLNPDHLYYPAKSKMETGHTEPEGGDDDENRQNHAMDGESAEHEYQNGLNTDADLSKSKRKETGSVYPEERPQDKSDSEKGVKAKGEGGGKPNIGHDAVEIEIDSGRGADSGDDSYKESYQCADPEFNNFDSDVSCFAVNQYWSCYDSADGMPRFYAKVKKVRLSPFELSIAWLEADSADDTLKKWIDAELPVGCGTFRVGKTQKISGCDTFAQQVHCEKGKRGSLIIHPRRGEVWALFRDWDLSWSSQPDSHKEFKYEVVEVLSDFDAMGVRVCYLDKVEGFVSLFQRSRQSAIESFMIRPKEIYRLSHCIRSFKMTGSERGGVPVGSFELDPAALPLNPDHLYYPAKSKMETGHTEPEGGDDDENRQNHAMDGESAEHEYQNGLNTDADLSKSKRKETGSVYPEERPQDKSDSEKGVKAKGEGGGKPNIGHDAVEIEIDSGRGADSGDDSYKESYQCADPEFNNFDSDVSCFAVNQYWSCYDSADGMPRFYAKVKKVRLSPFELSIAWLEADSADDTLKKWIDAELPVGCGTFRVGKTQKISGCDTFAQQVHCEKGKRGSLIIHPRRGEVWALFRDWDLSWSSQPDSFSIFKYEVVEVLSDFDAMGVRVCYLDKVEGFVSLFQRSRQSAIESFMITPKEIYRLSHCIRSFKMTGFEREGVPVGSFELDPAALPLNPDHLYYPAKSKIETDHCRI